MTLTSVGGYLLMGKKGYLPLNQNPISIF